MNKIDKLELRQFRESWNEINIAALSDEDKIIYLTRKRAVDLYIDGVSSNTIIEKTGIVGSEINRLVKRCANKDADGSFVGYAALIPNRRCKKTKNKLTQLFLNYPTLEKFILGKYFGDKAYTLEKNMNIRTLHKLFIDECRRLGIQDYEYPFILKDNGYSQLYRFINEKRTELQNLSIKRENKENQQKFASTGYGKISSFSTLTPFSNTQIDGHKIDMLYTVEVENEQGEIVRMPATRAWILAVIDVSTRTILGYSVSPYENYNQYDLLRAVHNAIVPHKKIEFTHAGFKYSENGGFPSLALPETQWASIDMLMLDNAKSHLAKNTIDKLVNNVKCTVNFGSVATPETRGIVERFFRTLETSGFHRLPATTGSNIRDKKRNNPEKECVKYNITYSDICEILEYLIAEYNNSAHSFLENQTPLQVMERRIRQAGMTPYIMPISERINIEKLTYFTEERILRGGYSSGTKPYVSFLGTKYHAYDISIPMNLIGEKVYLEVNPNDVSHIDLYNKDGIFIANLVAVGEWGRRPHSIKTHQYALKRKNKNLETNTIFTPNLSKYEQELRENAKKSRRDRTKAAIVKTESSSIYQNKKQKDNNNYRKVKPINTKKAYTKDEMDLINSISIEEAYKRGLI